MVIQKFLHSCLLLEESGKKLLIDPGLFSFVEAKLRPEEIGPVDVILFTHKHPDHYYPRALHAIIGSFSPSNVQGSTLTTKRSNLNRANQYPTIITHAEIGELLTQEELAFDPIAAGETKTISGFTIRAFTAPHGPIPAEPPHNLAYLINDTVLHPGDSLDLDERSLASITEAKLQPLPVLALPIAGPWLRLVDALAFAKSLQSKHVIPIHDAMIKDFMLERMYATCKTALESVDIAFHTLGVGEALSLPDNGSLR